MEVAEEAVVVVAEGGSAYVPLRWLGKDPRVESIMLEVRRDTYMDEATGGLISLGQLTAGYVSLIDGVA